MVGTQRVSRRWGLVDPTFDPQCTCPMLRLWASGGAWLVRFLREAFLAACQLILSVRTWASFVSNISTLLVIEEMWNLNHSTLVVGGMYFGQWELQPQSGSEIQEVVVCLVRLSMFCCDPYEVVQVAHNLPSHQIYHCVCGPASGKRGGLCSTPWRRLCPEGLWRVEGVLSCRKALPKTTLHVHSQWPRLTSSAARMIRTSIRNVHQYQGSCLLHTWNLLESFW